MKRSVLVLVLVLALVLAGVLVWHNTVRLGNPGCAVITYSYGEVYFREELYGEDVDNVLRVLNGKWQHVDNPACGFDEDISITISGCTFALACDQCGVVKNCATGQYLYISDGERDVLEAMFISRGGKFPCL